jgi:hypothetical protein
VYHSGAFVDFGAEVMGNLPTAYVLTQDGSRIGKFDPITEHLKRNQKIQVTGRMIGNFLGVQLVTKSETAHVWSA